MPALTPLQLVTAYLGTVDLPALRSALSAAVRPGDTEQDVEALCVALVDALVPEELLPAWQDAAQEVIDDAGQRLARLVLQVLRPQVSTGRRRLSAPAERALSLAEAARARAAELTVTVEDSS